MQKRRIYPMVIIWVSCGYHMASLASAPVFCR